MFHKISSLDITTILVISVYTCVSSVYSEGQQVDSKRNKGSPSSKQPNLKFHIDYNRTDPNFHYALDPTATKRLALAEEHLVADILKTVPTSLKDDSCLKYLRKYLNEFDQDTKAVKREGGIYRANIVTENPNLSLRLIRRIVVTLLNHTVNSCKNSFPNIVASIDNTFTALDLTVPREGDLDDALTGLLRIHHVYGFNATTEIRFGIFNGVNTEALLYFEDSLALAIKAIELETESLAFQWLVSASIGLVETGLSIEETVKEEKDLNNAWDMLKTLVKVDSFKDVHKMLRNSRQDYFSPYYNYEYFATCRGEYKQSVALQNKLRCFNQRDWDPYFYINPVKTQVLSGDPLIYQFYDFVGNKTIDFVLKSIHNKMSRSGFISSDKMKGVKTPVRSSMGSWFFEKIGPHEILELVKLTKRTEKLTGLEVYKELASQPLSIVRYGSLGGHYEFHLDSVQGSLTNFAKVGDRMATLLMFLSDVKMGGFTAFPLVGTYARPVKGSAILWYNTKLNGNPDQLTRHGGCPVILGAKTVANRWIYQYENMFREPCTLNPEE